MLIPIRDILSKYKIKAKGIIHVGAHWAEEHDDYMKCGIERFVYIEPCKEAFSVLMQKFGSEDSDSVIVINVACGSEIKQDVMYVSHQNQGQSNSFLKPKLHLQQHPEILFNDAEIVKITTLDSLPINQEGYDILAMDTEGYEGEVLKGATETLKHINIIYTEVQRGETREGNILIEDMDKVLEEFKRVETYWPSPSWTWGDAVYIRKSLL